MIMDQAAAIGRVVSVSGSQIICLLDGKCESADGAVYSLEVGAMVTIPTSRSTVFGLARGVSIPIPSNNRSEEEMQVAEIELVGEILRCDEGSDPFQRGISVFPTLGNPVFRTSQDELRLVHALPGIATAQIGTIYHDRSLMAHVKTDDLLAKHFAVLGTTGTGKSCAVTVILKAILRENENARILLLDPHDEYAHAFGAQAQRLDPAATLELPYWFFNFDEFCEVVIGTDELRMAQTALLGEAIVAAKTSFLDKKVGYAITVDTPIPYRIVDVLSFLTAEQGKLQRPEPLAAYQRLTARLKNLSNEPRYSFMFGRPGSDRMAEILSDLFRIPVRGKPITIADLSRVPSEVLNVVVSVLARLTLEFAMWSGNGSPILMVCEEAHRYAPREVGLGFEPTKRALARIAKEGRKHGVSLCVVSQRPSDLAPEMLSECNTIFALRMSNPSDQELIRAATADTGMGLLEFLPALRTGEAIALGEGVPIPQRMTFTTLPANEMPLAKVSSFSTAWKNEGEEAESVASVVERWRRRARGVSVRTPVENKDVAAAIHSQARHLGGQRTG
jgi:DNA helicase HerA-like ATPase